MMRAWMKKMAPVMAMILAGCAGSYAPAPLTEKQAVRLEQALAGKVPGAKIACISRLPQTHFTAISGTVLLYRVSGKLVYRNDLIGNCPGLARGDALILRSWGSQICRGDMATSADLAIGVTTGACALGDFTPYRAPGK